MRMDREPIPLRLSSARLDSLWTSLLESPHSASVQRNDTLDVNGDGTNDVLWTIGCGTAICIYDTFVRDGNAVIYVGQLETGLLGLTVCEDESDRPVVVTAWSRLYGGGASLLRITADSIETISEVYIGPKNTEEGPRFPEGFFPSGCDFWAT